MWVHCRLRVMPQPQPLQRQKEPGGGRTNENMKPFLTGATPPLQRPRQKVFYRPSTEKSSPQRIFSELQPIPRQKGLAQAGPTRATDANPSPRQGQNRSVLATGKAKSSPCSPCSPAAVRGSARFRAWPCHTLRAGSGEGLYGGFVGERADLRSAPAYVGGLQIASPPGDAQPGVCRASASSRHSSTARTQISISSSTPSAPQRSAAVKTRSRAPRT